MRLHVTCQNRIGIANDILDILVKYEIDLHGIEAGSDGQIYLNFPNLEFGTFKDIMPQIRMIAGVIDVSTVLYMPLEREQQELKTLLRALPEPILSIDPKGNILVANIAAQRVLKLSPEQMKGTPIKQWIKGFNINKWLSQADRTPQTSYIQLKNITYLCDVHPIEVPEVEAEEAVQAGAVLTFKSPERLGRQIAAFQQTSGEFDLVVAESSAMKKLIRQAKKMSQLDAPLLLVGEIGTGKELLAKACHQHSLRRDHSFSVFNCASVSEEEVKKRLFGEYADSEYHSGLIEACDEGSLFLDNIESLSPDVQQKLLIFLQDKSFVPLGTDSTKTSDTRIIFSTSENLFELCESGGFKEELYYRLNVLSLQLPNLQERRTDIVPLAEHFISRFTESDGRYISLSSSSKNKIMQYPWPGNVRQLENAMLKSVALVDSDVMEPEHIHLPSMHDDETLNYLLEDQFEGTLDGAVKKFEAELLKRLYPAYPSSRQLGKKLGVSHTAIANKLREYGIGKAHQKKLLNNKKKA